MAKAEIQMPEELMASLEALGDKTDGIIQAALEAGAEVVVLRVRGNLASVIGRNLKERRRSTGALLAALGVSPVKIDHNGVHNLKVGFGEPRRGGGINAKLATILEYGKSGQPPKPFLRPARSASRAPCIAAMQQKFEEEVNGI